MPDPILTTEQLSKHFGGISAIDGVSLAIENNEVCALIGPNGAGKTTFVGLLTGMIRPDDGRIYFRQREISDLPIHRRAQLGLARSFQITSIFLDMTAVDNVALAIQVHQGHSFRFWRDARADATLRKPAAAVLDQVGLAARADVTAAELSHGEHRQLEIAMAIASAPKMLLLDEPMAGMGPDESQCVLKLLHGLKRRLTIFLIEHDMDAVFALADRIFVMVRGRVIASGTPREIRANEEVRRAYLGDGGPAR
jgi:branched-chain amino acid transport system ATP-binding protein